eukprot:TRINITY_DN25006_c0_g1_i8.p1 TRINITY_DN25006_c0_g1~~TRINITY_DN25006_c0_g1_i8.p1  ORF type:complete len:712 (-),score=133.68 TRINITY_DN25006_c0_g1_i8:319-2454(-)
MGKHNGRVRKSKDGLGKALANRSKVKGNGNNSAANHGDQPDQQQLNFQSVIERNDLDELLAMADLAGRDFVAERGSIKVISMGGVTDPEEVARAQAAKEAAYVKYADQLRIPRRPKWNHTTTKSQLDQMEKSDFLEWRRNLARLEDEEGLVMTPFEKNLEVWRQLWRVLERSDVVIQVVDAREPLTYRCPDLEKYCLEIFHTKNSMLLLNKADLLNAYQRSVWADYFDEQGIPYVFWSARQDLERTLAENKPFADQAQKEMSEEVKEEAAAVVVDPRIKLVTAEELLQRLEEFASNAIAKGDQWLDPNRNPHLPSDEASASEAETTDDKQRRLMVGIVGYPNVGKSSTINALYGAKKTAVHTTPGKTKHFQTLNVTDKLTLCDCPGLVFPKFATSKPEMVAAGVIPIDKLTDIRGPIEVISRNVPKEVFEETYGFKFPPRPKNTDPDSPLTAAEILRVMAWSRGWNASRGLPDEFKAGRFILKDYVGGKLPHCEMPPGWVDSDEEEEEEQDDDDDYEEDDEGVEGVDNEEYEEENSDEPVSQQNTSGDPQASQTQTPQSKFSFSFTNTVQLTPDINTSLNDLITDVEQNGNNDTDNDYKLFQQVNNVDPDPDLDLKPDVDLQEANEDEINKNIQELGDSDMLDILSMKSKPEKPRRADHKFQKKPPRSKGFRRGQWQDDGNYDGGAFAVGKKGGIVGIGGYTQKVSQNERQ